MALPLEGIKVIDFTGVQAGPACCQMLAGFSADVLKSSGRTSERWAAGLDTEMQRLGDRHHAYIYFTIQEQNWARVCDAIGKPKWKSDPAYTTARAAVSHFKIFAGIEEWFADNNQFEAVQYLRKFEVPCAPVLSMKEIEKDSYLRACGSIVEVDEERRGKYLTVGCPMKFSTSSPTSPASRCRASIPARC